MEGSSKDCWSLGLRFLGLPPPPNFSQTGRVPVPGVWSLSVPSHLVRQSPESLWIQKCMCLGKVKELQLQLWCQSDGPDTQPWWTVAQASGKERDHVPEELSGKPSCDNNVWKPLRDERHAADEVSNQSTFPHWGHHLTPQFLHKLKDQHILQVNPQMLCYSSADFIFISLLVRGKWSHVNSMYMMLNQILGEINFRGFTEAGQPRIWCAV